MKIAYLLTQDLNSPSGLGRFGPIAREMAKLGHEVLIYALHPDLSALSTTCFTQDGVRVRYLAPMHVKKHGSHKYYYSTAAMLKVAALSTIQLTRAALSSQADIIHVCKPHPMNSPGGLLARYLRGKRLFVDCDDYEAGSNLFFQGWQQKIVAFFEKTTPQHAFGITTNTLFMKSLLESWGVPSEKILYLPNGVERSRFYLPDPDLISDLRARLGLKEKKVIAYIGSMSLSNHPVDLLLAAFAQVRARVPDAALLLVGGGGDLETIKEMAAGMGLSDSVRFCGRVDPAEVQLYYRLTQVSVDPVHDNDAARGRSPLKLFESWACGTPFVSADVGDRRMLLGDPPAGLLARPGNPSSLAEAITSVLENDELAHILRQRGNERVEDYYWDRLSQSVVELYRRKIGQ
jgi:glycosyltransferase involved in cell wall biosynthesis